MRKVVWRGHLPEFPTQEFELHYESLVRTPRPIHRDHPRLSPTVARHAPRGPRYVPSSLHNLTFSFKPVGGSGGSYGDVRLNEQPGKTYQLTSDQKSVRNKDRGMGSALVSLALHAVSGTAKRVELDFKGSERWRDHLIKKLGATFHQEKSGHVVWEKESLTLPGHAEQPWHAYLPPGYEGPTRK